MASDKPCVDEHMFLSQPAGKILILQCSSCGAKFKIKDPEENFTACKNCNKAATYRSHYMWLRDTDQPDTSGSGSDVIREFKFKKSKCLLHA